MAAPLTLADLAVPLSLEPMEAKLVSELPDDGEWQFEPKWDGFRCLAFRAGDHVDLRAKSGKPLTRYFPELVEVLKALKPKCFVLDGELAIPATNGLSFDALQQRIHPAESRVAKLAAETPSILILFDMLVDAKNKSLVEEPLTKRRAALEAFYTSVSACRSVKLSPATLSHKEADRLAEPNKHLPRRRRSQAPRRPLPARRARHAEGETFAQRGLRGGRLPLR